jgi:urease accessory protein
MITRITTTMAIIMNTSTDMIPTPHLVTLMQWLSPAYPVGGFSYSHGSGMGRACRRCDRCGRLSGMAGRCSGIWQRAQ